MTVLRGRIPACIISIPGKPELTPFVVLIARHPLVEDDPWKTW